MTGEQGDFGVVTFHSTHSVLKAEKIFKEAGFEKVRLIPVPSEISSDCGVTVRFLMADLEEARGLLDQLQDDLEGIYHRDGDRWETIFQVGR